MSKNNHRASRVVIYENPIHGRMLGDNLGVSHLSIVFAADVPSKRQHLLQLTEQQRRRRG